jgi:hypothetical protein
MKKILLLSAFFILSACAGSTNNKPVFDHTVIKQLNLKKPSFTLIIENDQKNYYTNQVEDAFIRNKITLYSNESQITSSASEGKSSGVISSGGKFGFGAGRSKISTTEKTVNIDQTNADCIYYLDCYNWTFKVMSAETRELLMKGRIINDFDQEILRMYQELAGK